MEIAPYLPGFVAAYSILLIAASSPGPSVAMLLGIATSQGRTPALTATLGIACGSITINLLTMMGIGWLLSQVSWGMAILRITGSGYLLWLAHGAFQRALHPPAFQLKSATRKTLLKYFLVGYFQQITNPKAIAFWLAIASVGATEGAGMEIVALFVAGAFVISFSCHAAWAIALSAKPVRTAYATARRYIEATLGMFFCFASYKLLTLENE